MLRVGLVGAGSMGANHARIISQSHRGSLAMVFDVNRDVSTKVASMWNSTVARSADEMTSCDAVVVASSTPTHHAIGKSLIDLGIPVLIEKPLCSTLWETTELIRLSEEHDSVICCGFVERFNPALRTALSLLDGPVRHMSTQRHSPFNPRASLSVVMDLLIHDLDLTARVAPATSPTHVGASLWASTTSGYIEIADCTLQFDQVMIASHSASRWGQKKTREVRLQTDTLLMEVDLVRMTVTGYRHCSTNNEDPKRPASLRSETLIEVPFVRHSGEPLALQFDHFIDLVMGLADHNAERASIEAAHLLAHTVSSVSNEDRLLQ